jgi:hypothetical protein
MRKKVESFLNLLLLLLFAQQLDRLQTLSLFHARIVLFINGILYKNLTKFKLNVNSSLNKFQLV